MEKETEENKGNKIIEKQFIKNIILSVIFMIIFFIDIFFYFKCFEMGTISVGIVLTTYSILAKSVQKIIFIVFIILVFFINLRYIKKNKNIKKFFINIILPILIIVILGLVIIKIYDLIFDTTIFNIMVYNQTDLTITSDNEYLVVTNLKNNTLEDDGGSNTNSYYKIDLSKSLVIKYEDKYKGFVGYEYLGKVLYKKNLSDEEVLQLEDLLDTIFNNVETDLLGSDKNTLIAFLHLYYFSSQDYSDVEVYNEDLIEEFESIVEE